MPMSTPCPVCSRGVYTDPKAPMAKDGTPNPARHSCIDNDTWRAKVRFGGSVSRLRDRLNEAPKEKLTIWPRVLELKRLAEANQPLE